MKSNLYMRLKNFLLVCSVLASLVSSELNPAHAGIKLGDDDTNLNLGLLLQSWGEWIEDGAPSADNPGTDFYLRRFRMLMYGKLHDRVNYFVETDNPNFGKNGDYSSRTFVQDAWIEFDLYKSLQIDVGMLLVPFSHHGMQGAVSLHSLDYHGSLIRYPGGSHKVWRDMGVMARGLLLEDRFEYRLAVLNGVRGGGEDLRNPDDWPRMTARFTYNLFDFEGGAGTGGFFYDGIYLKSDGDDLISAKKIVSFGLSADWQKDLNVSLTQGDGDLSRRRDYFALAADVFVDLPIDENGLMGLCGQINFYYYDHGDRRLHPDTTARSLYDVLDDTYTSEYTGFGIMSELGFRYSSYEAIMSVDWFDSTKAEGDLGDLLSIYGGINWWMYGHSTSLKLQMGGSKINGSDWGAAAQIQVQLLL